MIRGNGGGAAVVSRRQVDSLHFCSMLYCFHFQFSWMSISLVNDKYKKYEEQGKYFY